MLNHSIHMYHDEDLADLHIDSENNIETFKVLPLDVLLMSCKGRRYLPLYIPADTKPNHEIATGKQICLLQFDGLMST